MGDNKNFITNLKFFATTTIVAAGLWLGANINDNEEIAWALESTTLTTNDGVEVDISEKVPMIVIEKEKETLHVRTIDKNGNPIEGNISSIGELETEKLPKGFKSDRLRFAVTKQPDDHHIDVVNIRNTPELRII